MFKVNMCSVEKNDYENHNQIMTDSKIVHKTVKTPIAGADYQEKKCNNIAPVFYLPPQKLYELKSSPIHSPLPMQPCQKRLLLHPAVDVDVLSR